MFIAFINSASASGARPMRECKIKIFSAIYKQSFSTHRSSRGGKKTHEGYILIWIKVNSMESIRAGNGEENLIDF